jgi:UDP-glucuronate 4-epimerase
MIYNNLRVLISGGAGFIGSHLSEALLERGAFVTAIDNFDPFYPCGLKLANLQAALAHAHFALLEGDIRDAAFVRQALADSRAEVIVHLAAKAGVRPSLDDPALYADVNVRGTAVMLEAARQAGVKNFVFASSSSVYGNLNEAPFAEDARTDFPVSPYGATKKAGEAQCYAHHQVYGMNISCLRFFTVYGPRQRPDLAIRKFVRLALADAEIPLFGDGSSRRDYTHVRDILTGILGAIRWGQEAGPRYGIFNLGSSRPVLLRELVEWIEEGVGHALRRKALPFQSGDVFQTYADTARAEHELGFRHDVPFRDGLREFVAWMREHDREA